MHKAHIIFEDLPARIAGAVIRKYDQITPPIQKIGEKDGVLRFQENILVRYLLDNGSLNLNDLNKISCSDEDRMQFAQLIGYSVSGFQDICEDELERHPEVLERIYELRISNSQ